MEKEFRLYFGGANKATAPSSSGRPKRASVVNATTGKTNPIKKVYDFAVNKVVLPSSDSAKTDDGHDANELTKKDRRRSTWEKPAEFILGVEVSRRGNNNNASNSNQLGNRGDENCDNYNTDNADNVTYAEDFEFFEDNDKDIDEENVIPTTMNSLRASIKSLLSTPVKPSASVDPSVDDNSPSWFKALKEENTDHLNGRRLSQTSISSSSGSKPIWLSTAKDEKSFASREEPVVDYLPSLIVNTSPDIPRAPAKSPYRAGYTSPASDSGSSKSKQSPGSDGFGRDGKVTRKASIDNVNNTLATLAGILEDTSKALPSSTLRRLVPSPPKRAGDNVDDLLSELSLLHMSVDASAFKRQPVIEEKQTITSAKDTFLYNNFLSRVNSIATIRCRSVTLVLHSTWGSDDYIALDGITFMDYMLNNVKVATVVTNAECDIGLSEKSDIENLLKAKCWMAPVHPTGISITFSFPVETEIAAIKVTNYNNIVDKSTTARGVKILAVIADGISLGNAIIRRATGFDDKSGYDNSQLLLLDSLVVCDEKSMLNKKMNKYKPIAYNQEYEVCNMPCGMLFKFVLINNHGIDNFIAFDSINFYDENYRCINMENNLSKISTYPQLQKPYSFLFPFQIETNGTIENQKQVFVMFNTPIHVSAIKIVNNNCCDYSVHLDENILFMGSMGKKESSKFIVFSNSFLEKFKDERVANQIYEQEVNFINDNNYQY